MQSSSLDTLEFTATKCAVCGVDNGDPIAVGEDFEYRTAPDSFLMMQCRQCRLLYLNPRPSDKELSRIYPDSYHAFNFSEADFGFVHQVRRRLEARRLLKWCRGLPPGARILDVGCGDGFHLSLLSEFGDSSWTLQGVDSDPRAATAAGKRGIEVFPGLIEDLPRSEPYDLAFMIMTIEHLFEPQATLRAVAEHLKPGGRLVIVTDNSRSPDFSLFGGRHWGGYHFPRHTYLFDAKNLGQLAELAGFSSQSIKTSFSPVNWVYSIRNWIGDWHGPSWLVSRFSLKTPISLAVFTLIDLPLSWMGCGAILQAVLIRRPSTSSAGKTR